jgi:hypothetical protein
LLAGRHDRFGLVQLDDHRPGVGALDDAIHDLALPVRIFLIHGVALVIANFLEHHLLGRLRGDAAEVLRRLLDADFVTHHGGVFESPRFWQGNFGFRIGHLGDHAPGTPNVHLSSRGINGDFDFLFGARHLLVNGLEGMLDRGQHSFAGDAAFRRDLCNSGIQITFHPENLLARVAQR